MRGAATAWLEEGLRWAARGAWVGADDERLSDPRSRAFLAAVSPVGGLMRLYGAIDPARAAGTAASLPGPLLRAVARAALCEFTPWPLSTVSGCLRRAEQDAAAGLAHRATASDIVIEIWDGLAVAWARHDPGQLPRLFSQLHGQWLSGRSGALWATEIRHRAAGRALLPAELGDVPPSTWLRQARWGLTSASRATACLQLAAAAYRAGLDEAAE